MDVTDVVRILILAGLFGAYFALLAQGRAAAPAGGLARSADAAAVSRGC